MTQYLRLSDESMIRLDMDRGVFSTKFGDIEAVSSTRSAADVISEVLSLVQADAPKPDFFRGNNMPRPPSCGESRLTPRHCAIFHTRCCSRISSPRSTNSDHRRPALRFQKIRLIAKPAVTPSAPVDSMWELIGGRDTFEKLVREFYVGVATDEVLLPMYPEQPDLEGAIQRLTGFLEQYWGGPNTYSQECGHLHYSTSAMFAGIPVSVAAATSYNQDLNVAVGGGRGHDGGQSFNFVHVFDETIVHSVATVASSTTVGEVVDAAEVQHLLAIHRQQLPI